MDLNITNDFAYLSNTDHINDPVLKAIHKYNWHPSILLLQDMIKIENEFTIDTNSLILEINRLKSSKACPLSNIPIKMFKQFAFPYDDTVTSII